ncbi:MAG TPA: nicotinate phosphoribosyltransferase [Actinomycetota bacterium]|nr:nicotinate phosphoribosyltransferase [Actinomycetota bacterium]
MTWVDSANAALLTDLYELTMAASYHRRGMNAPATFDLFVRDLPARRNFMVVAGLEQALSYLEELAFDDGSLGYLESLQMFDASFLDYLGGFRFSGEVWAMPEGEIAFEKEPLLRVTAPLIEAQIVETFLLNCVTFQTMVASKAARVSLASGDRKFIDFSLRRDHGADAGLKAARASFIAGASATSNVLAGKMFGIPVSGTMAHSYVMAFESEIEAFRAYGRDFPEQAVLLIDTFDVAQGARRAVDVANELSSEGFILRGVRIDSGDLAELSRTVRGILDAAGFPDTQIILSGDLDEYRVEEMLRLEVPVDVFGVGTQMGTSADSPFLGAVYKLVAEQDIPKVKLSAGKVTLPGLKQVHRVSDRGHFERDVITLEGERVPGGRPLLERVMSDGRRMQEIESLEVIRDRCASSLEQLPDPLRSLGPDRAFYPVELSEDLEALAKRVEESLAAQRG